jgi:hypothetical protein
VEFRALKIIANRYLYVFLRNLSAAWAAWLWTWREPVPSECRLLASDYEELVLSIGAVTRFVVVDFGCLSGHYALRPTLHISRNQRQRYNKFLNYARIFGKKLAGDEILATFAGNNL